jgi:hypothetical protein
VQGCFSQSIVRQLVGYTLSTTFNTHFLTNGMFIYVSDTPNPAGKEKAMSKRTKPTVRENHPVMKMSLEQQFMVVAGALNRATQQGNSNAINGLAMMLKGYEEAIKEANHRADELASGVHPDVYEASRKWNI